MNSQTKTTIKNIILSFRDLTRFELILWLASAAAVAGSFVASWLISPDEGKDLLTLIGSLIGVTALIFVSKGYPLGQALVVIFSIFYGIISFYFTYYGEMITYLGMTAPIAMIALIQWIKHPFEESQTVTVSRPGKKQLIILGILAVLVTIAFYFILKALGNANLLVSTLSITTSFVAASLTVLRSAAYAIWYAANDLVLVVLWLLATLTQISYLPMVVCFAMFFINDMYGFFNWRRLSRDQRGKQD